MTPAERARAWYPDAAVGGGNNGTASGVFLWKPTSDSNGKAAIHTPANVRVDGITVAGKRYGVGSYGNGYRPLFRLDKPGAAYGNGVPVTMHLHGGGVLTIIVPSGAKRFEKSGFADHGGTDSPPVKPPVPAPAVQAIVLPDAYAAKVGLVAVLSGRKMHHATRDPANPARWTHAGRKASHYGLRWNVAPGGSVATYNAGPLGLWSVTDGARFLTLAEILALLGAGPVEPPVTPPPAPPNPPTPPAPAPTKDAELTATGLRLAPDLVPLVAKVLVLTHAETPAKTQKFMTSRAGDEWSTGQPLSAYPSAVYQIFWTREPPARIPHHQGFPGAIKNVSHVMPSGAWNPPTTRNP
jgi:hypothetical protein